MSPCLCLPFRESKAAQQSSGVIDIDRTFLTRKRGALTAAVRRTSPQSRDIFINDETEPRLVVWLDDAILYH